MSSIEIRNQKLMQLKALKERGIAKVPLSREIGKKEETKELTSADDNFSTEAQAYSIPGSSLLSEHVENSPFDRPSKKFGPLDSIEVVDTNFDRIEDYDKNDNLEKIDSLEAGGFATESDLKVFGESYSLSDSNFVPTFTESNKLKTSVRDLEKDEFGMDEEENPNFDSGIEKKGKSQVMELISQIQAKKLSISSLQVQNTELAQVNNSIKSATSQALASQSALRQEYSEKRKKLESSVTALKSKLLSSSHSDSPLEPAAQRLAELKKKLENIKKEVSEKEANCKSLKKMLDELSYKTERLRGAAPSFVPDPPAEEGIIDPPYRNLISDVGSTGNLHKRSEESKALNYPSPDPLEGGLPQSTGETKYIGIEGHYQGGATPPNDSVSIDHYDLQYEESKDPGTPKRDTSNPRDSSGSSTPRRYRDTNTAHVHNLLGSFHNQNSEEENDFFNAMTRDKRKQDPSSKSLFD